MFQEERYSKIYEILKSKGNATVGQLMKQLYTSEATIRRDLEHMEKNGLIKRVWGGAMLPAVNKDIPSFVRQKSNSEEKEKIGLIASKLLSNSQSIFFDSSTTCMALVPYMSELKDITVITSSLKMSKRLSEETSASINLLGGNVYENYILTGYTAVKAVKEYHTDILFFSCSGISTDAGITSVEPKVVEVVKEMINNSSKKVLLCDCSKVGKNSLLRLTGLDTPDYVIMNEVPDDPELVKALGKRLITSPAQLKK